MEVVNKLRSLSLELRNLREKSNLVLCEAKSLLCTSKNDINGHNLLAALSNLDEIPTITSDQALLSGNFHENSEQNLKKEIKCDHPNGEDLKSDPAVYGPLVAANTVILRSMFSFLKLEDLKNCRQTCKIWEESSEMYFLKLAKPLISTHSRSPEEFLGYFENVSIQKFSNIAFTHSNCFTSVLTRIFQQHSANLTSLTLDHITLRNEDGNTKVDWFDLSPLIGDKLSTLVVVTNKDSLNTKATRMVLSVKNLASVKYLTLKYCKLVLCEGITNIQAKEYQFFNVTFSMENEDKLITAIERSSNLINFHEFLQNRNTDNNNGCTFNLKMDKLGQKMHTLYLPYWDFTNNLLKNGRGLKNLSITGIFTNFQWSFVPDTVETLNLDLCINRDRDGPRSFLNRPEIFLPNLKVLDCTFFDEIHWLPNFRGCNQLTKVKIQSRYGTTRVDLNWLPHSVQELCLTNVLVSVSEGFMRNLESLSLVKCPFSEIISNLDKFKTKNLLLTNELYKWNSMMHVCIHISHLPLKRFVIGNFEWEDEWQFKNSDLAHCVDKMSNYYVFKKGFGKSVHKSSVNFQM